MSFESYNYSLIYLKMYKTQCKSNQTLLLVKYGYLLEEEENKGKVEKVRCP